MQPLVKGRYTARLAETDADIARAQALRHLCFITHRGLVTPTTDADAFDDHCQHILVEDTLSAQLVCCFRVQLFTNGAILHSSYSAQTYDLSRLAKFADPLAEIGRFCIHPDWHDPDILRLAWGALTRVVDNHGVLFLFGCTSFDGADPALHQAAFSHLNRLHLAPERWRPGRKSAHSYLLADAGSAFHSDKQGASGLPSLLRTYLLMGGWVSDHAVIDRALNTLHVFTGLDINAIPPIRARLLRGLAA